MVTRRNDVATVKGAQRDARENCALKSAPRAKGREQEHGIALNALPSQEVPDWSLITLCEMMEAATEATCFDDGLARFQDIREFIHHHPGLQSIVRGLDGLETFIQMLDRMRRWSQWQGHEPNNAEPCPPQP